MLHLRQPARPSNSLLRLAIRQVSAGPFLTGSLLLGMAPAAQAISLGDIGVRSTLGQKLDATVQVYLGPGETLNSGCIAPGSGSSDLRRVPGVDVATPAVTGEGSFQLRVTTASALYEPMYELELIAQCPGAPGLSRQYVLMLDLPAATLASRNPATQPREVAEPTVAPTVAQAPVAEPRATLPRRTARPLGATIEEGTRYRVVKGDTLSSIAARVRGRKVTLWALADAIQAANPEAFIRNDANLITLGSEILIPGVPATAAAASIPASSASTPATPAEPAAIAAPAPVPVVEQVPAAAPSAPPAVAVVPTPAPAVRATPPVQRRVTAPAAAIPDASATAAVESDDPNPVVAAAAGIFFGLSISTLLWFLGRRPSRKPRPASRTDESEPPSALNTALLAATPAALENRPGDTGFSVYYTPPHDDALAAEFADELEPTAIAPRAKAPTAAPTAAAVAPGADVTAELEELFNGTDTTIQKRLNAEKTIAARSLGNQAAIEEDQPVSAGNGSAVDFLVGDPTSEEATLAGETVEQPRPRPSTTAEDGTLDLQALSAAATKDKDQAQTLLEALTLLQRDYEDELTASQVLEQSAVRAILGKELDEPTQIRGPEARPASAGGKSR